MNWQPAHPSAGLKKTLENNLKVFPSNALALNEITIAFELTKPNRFRNVLEKQRREASAPNSTKTLQNDGRRAQVFLGCKKRYWGEGFHYRLPVIGKNCEP